jgi:hypothetical protein
VGSWSIEGSPEAVSWGEGFELETADEDLVGCRTGPERFAEGLSVELVRGEG